MLLDIIPENPLQEMAGALDGSSKGNGIIAVMFFALIFGAALAQVGDSGQAVVKFLEGVFAASMRILDWAMRPAPLSAAEHFRGNPTTPILSAGALTRFPRIVIY
jgi:DAACS family dicarboxylate/amino acid:cation (Na+ or H+) symporter